MKLVIFMVIVVVATGCCDGKAALRRKPKVYNALITTDEDLLQSQAYPVIQPTIHESGIAHYPYDPYNPYGVYNSHVVRLGQPIAPALTPKEQLSYPLPVPPQIPPQVMRQPLVPQPLAGYPLPQNPPTAPAAENQNPTSLPPTALAEQPQPTVQPSDPSELPKNPNQATKVPTEQLPIPLNQYGLPPSLIPFRQRQPYHQPYPSPHGPPPFHLPPYRFTPVAPLYYNSLPGLRQQFLPPYDYLPTGPQFPLSNTIPTDKNYPQPPSQPLPKPTPAPPTPVPPTPAPPTPAPPTHAPPVTISEETTQKPVPSPDPIMPESDFENIKNGSKSEDSNVPDVPPPPIPSGAKSKQS